MVVLEIAGVSKRFGNLAALKDVSFTLGQGEILGLIGPNGTGKTTLVNLITGMHTCSSGDILFAGKSIRGLKPFQTSKLGISRTFQIAQPVVNMTALDNVMIGALFGTSETNISVRKARRNAEEILETIGLSEKKDVPADSLNVPDRKRLEFARVLAMKPKLLLLDEIMAGLTPKEIDEVVELIKWVRNAGVTIMVIEHVMKAISNVSDKILVLHHGEKIIEGPPEAVLNDNRVIEAYLGKRYRERAGLGQHPSYNSEEIRFKTD